MKEVQNNYCSREKNLSVKYIWKEVKYMSCENSSRDF